MAEVFSHLNRMDEKALKRFLAKTRSSSGCWLWTGAKDKDGYGKFSLDGISQRAHRVAYEHWKGDIPANHVIRHTCRNLCVNPKHLLSGTQQQNMDDKSK
jgi:HNH endonuclease